MLARGLIAFLLAASAPLCQSVAAAPQGKAFNNADEIAPRLVNCCIPPGAFADTPMSATAKLSFRVDGTPLGLPTFTYVSAPPGKLRDEIVRSVRAAILACTPLPFTAALGSAIAGRLFLIRFISNPVRKEINL